MCESGDLSVDIHSNFLVSCNAAEAETVSPNVLAARLPGERGVKPIRSTQVRCELRSGKCGWRCTVGTKVFYINILGLVASCVDAERKVRQQ